MNDLNLNSLYDLMGGETGVRTLVERFYDLMDSSPEAKDIRALHAASLKSSREKLFMFLSGWTGGPSLYIEKYGHPQLAPTSHAFFHRRGGARSMAVVYEASH
jgi:truncated hemoglobin YjbI